MVKVVEKKTFTTNCSKCKSTLEYEYSEVSSHVINHDYLGGYDIVYGIKCPVCNKVCRHGNH